MKHLQMIAAALLLAACAKEEDTPLCEEGNYGWVTVYNTEDDPYNFYINDSYQLQVPAFENRRVGIWAGVDMDLKLVQASGFVVFPTVFTAELDVARCEEYTW